MTNVSETLQCENKRSMSGDRPPISEQETLNAAVSCINSKVLVVDDEPEIIEEMAELLSDAGFDCDTTCDPQNALGMIRRDSDISVVVTDVKMPGMNGLEMARNLFDGLPLNREVAVIVVTGHAGTHEAIEALRLGAMDFLIKPISPGHLVHTVKRAAETVQLRMLERQFNKSLQKRVTERTAEVRELANDLQNTNRELEIANRVKGEFLTLISHELRTPLNAIIGYSELMAVKNGDSRQSKYSRNVSEAGKKLLRMVNTILDLIDVYSGDLTLQKSDVDVIDLIDRIVEVCRPRIDAKSLEFNIEKPKHPVFLHCDEERLTQAIGNILDNAIHFASTGEFVGMAVEANGGEVRISVFDTGKGMTAEEISIALEPFRQVDASLSKSHYGMGLGLTLSRMFVELHGGTVDIDSSPDVGTTVTMTIPVGER